MKEIMVYAMAILLFVLIVINIRAESPKNGNEILGRYQLPNELVIEIYEDSDGYAGKIVGLGNFENGREKDAKNPDKQERNNLLMGKVIVDGLHFDASKRQWVNGSMYAPEKGMTVNLKIISVNDSTVIAEGSKFLFSKIVSWERIP